MNEADFNLYLLCVMGVAVAIAIFNIVRMKQRGRRALFMAAAAIMFAVDVELYRVKAAPAILVGVGVIIFASLVGDAFMKFSANHQSKEVRK